MAMTKKQQFNPQPLLMFSLAVFLCPIVTAGFQEPLDWETGLDEGMYNLQSEPTFPFLSNSWLQACLFARLCQLLLPISLNSFDISIDKDLWQLPHLRYLSLLFLSAQLAFNI